MLNMLSDEKLVFILIVYVLHNNNLHRHESMKKNPYVFEYFQVNAIIIDNERKILILFPVKAKLTIPNNMNFENERVVFLILNVQNFLLFLFLPMYVFAEGIIQVCLMIRPLSVTAI